MLESLEGIFSCIALMWFEKESQFSCTDLSWHDAVNSELNFSVCCFRSSQLALLHKGIGLRGFLFNTALRWVSTIMTPSWSDIPGTSAMFLISLGLFVNKDQG